MRKPGTFSAIAFLFLGVAACGDGATTGSSDSASNPFGALIDEAPEGRAFYTPPEPIPGELGDVIWAREAESVPGGQLYVVLYRSENLRGEPIAISGWIGVPDGDAPAGGRPILTWGHGSRGVADECAPTIQDDPPSLDMPLLRGLLDRGIVVTASDYEGLGTPGLHPYVIGKSEANSMLDAARAARRFVPAAANDTLLIAGHSQGGHAMAFANEEAATYAPEFDVIGAVGSGAGVVDGEPFIPILLGSDTLRGIMVIAMGAQQAAYGADIAPPTRLLTDFGVSQLGALEEGCWSDILAHYGQFTREELFRDDYDLTFTNGENPNFTNSAGNRPGAAPIFLVHGTEDTTVPAAFIPPYMQKVCGQGNDVDVRFYAGYGHRAMYDPSSGAADAVLAWIDDRLARRPVPSACGAIPPIS